MTILNACRRSMRALGILAIAAMCLIPSTSANEEIYRQIMEIIGSEETAEIMDSYVLVIPGMPRTRTSEYNWAGFVDAYRTITGSADKTLGGNQFMHGGSVEAGLINIAVFLAQCLQETIQYDACDENNWSNGFPGVQDYPASAACGQAGQDYSRYSCYSGEGPRSRNVQCPIDNEMVVRARTSAGWSGAPPPLFCAPRRLTGGTPRWDFSTTCAAAEPGSITVPDFPDPYIDDVVKGGLGSDTCNVYSGQMGGQFSMDGCNPATGCPNAARVDTAGGKVHTDVEGCCWWGRGVIQTTGPCNTGKLNYYLTGTYYDNAGNAQKESDGVFPFRELNLCATPGLICDGPDALKWISGMFFWVSDVQTYSNIPSYGFDFNSVLTFGGKGMFNDIYSARGFVDSTSGLVNRGCPAATCPGAGPVHAIDERFGHYVTAIQALQHAYDPDNYSKPPGDPAPPNLGPWYSKPSVCAACNAGGTGLCGVKWWSGGEALCLDWATTKELCDESGGAAIAWCTDDGTASPTAGVVTTSRPTSRPTSQPTPRPTGQPTSRPTKLPETRPPTSQPTKLPETKPPTASPTMENDACAITVNRDECDQLMKFHSASIQQQQRRMSDANDRSRQLQDSASGDNDELCACWNFCGTAMEGCSGINDKRLLKCAAHALVAGCTFDDTTEAPTPQRPTCQVEINVDQCDELVDANPRQINPKDEPDCQCRSFCNGEEMQPCCRFDDAACVLQCDGDLVAGCPVYHDDDSEDGDTGDALDRIWNGQCALEVDLNDCPRLMNGDGAKDLTSDDCPCAHFCNGQFSHCCKHGEYCEPGCVQGWFVGGCDVSVFDPL